MPRRVDKSTDFHVMKQNKIPRILLCGLIFNDHSDPSTTIGL